MNELQLIPVIPVVPSKSEITTAINKFYADDSKTLIEKYITLKALEQVCKIAFTIPNRKKLIESALEYSKGTMTFDCNAATVQITKERISTTMKKYAYSDKLEELRKKNEREISELEIKIKALKTEIKENEIHEINNSIAQEITEMLTGEASETEYGIKVTLPK